MPCEDVTELLEIVLDEENRLVTYRLRKRTCGRAVGEESLLSEELAGRIDLSLLDLDPEHFADPDGSLSEAEFVLRYKHLAALQGGIRALAGLAPCGEQESVRIGQVAWDEGRMVVDAVVSVDVITEQIKACGRCKGCGVLTKR